MSWAAAAPGGPAPPRVVVVGAGIGGLAAALEASTAAEVVVLEAEPRPGGVIRTVREGPYLLEAGPDSLLGGKGAAWGFCERLGLAGRVADLSGPAEGPALLRGGRLVPLPAGMRLLVPTRLVPLLRSPLLTPRGRLRMAAERLVPPRRADGDESLASFVARRYGREAAETLAGPLAATLFLGDAARLSAALTVPALVEAERSHGSVARGIAARRRGRTAAGPPSLFTLEGGLETLVRAAADRLPPGALRVGAPVRAVRLDEPRGGWLVETADGGRVEARAVVLAVPAHAAARLVAGVDGGLARELGLLRHASCATVSLAYARGDVARPPACPGFFVAPGERMPFIACNVVSNKFPGRAPADRVVLRAFVGGAGREDRLAAGDDDVAGAVHRSLAALFGVRGGPELARVDRYPLAMPQPEVGEAERRARLDARLGRLRGLFVAGGAKGAVGVPDAVAAGLEAGRAASQHAAGGVAAAGGSP